MTGSRDDARQDRSTTRSEEAPAASELVRRVRGRLGFLAARGGRAAERIAASARDQLAGSALVRQGLAAQERGNLEAAFALLREAHEGAPADARVAAAFWDVAAAAGRTAEATHAATLLVRHHARAGAYELAAQYWRELVTADRAARLPPALLLRLAPVLRRWLEAAAHAPDGGVDAAEEGRSGADASAPDPAEEARALLLRALRDAAHPEAGPLSPALALRLFEEAHTLDEASARIGARAALASPDLHEARRARIEAWLEGSHGVDPTPEPPAPRAQAPGAARPRPAGASSPGQPPTPAPAARRPARPGRGAAERSDTARRSAPDRSDTARRRRVRATARRPARAAGGGPQALSDTDVAAAAARLPPAASAAGAAWTPRPRPPASGPATMREAAAIVRASRPAPAATAPAPRVTQVRAAARGEDALSVTLPAGRRRVPLSALAGVAVARIAPAEASPFVVVDLLLREPRTAPGGPRVLRLRSDTDAARVWTAGDDAPEEGLRSFLGWLLAHSRAVPLPDPDAALGLVLAEYPDLERYEEEVLSARLA